MTTNLLLIRPIYGPHSVPAMAATKARP